MADIKWEIKEHCGNIGEPSSSGWQKELNLVSWNEREPKYDIRDWSPDHANMGKGITLTDGELMDMYDVISEVLGRGNQNE